MWRTVERKAIRARKGERGITLTEMLVVIAIIGLFAFITIPSFRDFMNAFKVNSTAQHIRDMVRLGRQIAVAKKSEVAATVDIDADTYDAWEDEDEDQVKDADERSIRPVPPVPRFVLITNLTSNLGDIGSNAIFVMNSDGTIERPACGANCAESQWCVQVEMQINAQRRDRWTVFMKQSGKVDLLPRKDPSEANYCKW